MSLLGGVQAWRGPVVSDAGRDHSLAELMAMNRHAQADWAGWAPMTAAALARLREGEPQPPYRSAYDQRGSAEHGEGAEARFTAAAEARGWRVLAAHHAANAVDHTDAALFDGPIAVGAKAVTVDVKAAYGMAHPFGGARPSRFLLLELQGKDFRDGRPYAGWLRCGRATLLACEVQPHVFALLNRARVLAYLAARVPEQRDAASRAISGLGALLIDVTRERRERAVWVELQEVFLYAGAGFLAADGRLQELFDLTRGVDGPRVPPHVAAAA
jgi:hypothetical protein